MRRAHPDVDAEFDRFVRACIEPEHGPIDQWTRRLHPRVSSTPLHQIDVTMASGERHQVVCKSTSWATLPERTQRARSTRRHHPRREAMVYEHILDATEVGTARLLGTHPEHSWLMLSTVGGVPLTEVGPLDAWRAAARWLARFHANPSVHLASKDVPLAHHDDLWFEGLWSDFIAHCPLDRFVTLHRARDWFDRAVDALGRAPTVVAHGEFFASNVHAIAGDAEWSIAPVDWEFASWTSPTWDLAQLCAGFGPVERRQLADDYRDERRSALVDRGEPFDEWWAPALDAARVIVALTQLARHNDRDPLERQHDWWHEFCTAGSTLEGLP